MRNTYFALACCVLALSAGCNRLNKLNKKKAPISEIMLSNSAAKDRFVRGIYPGEGEWRWTAPTFAFALDAPITTSATYVEMDFTIPNELAQSLPLTLVGKVNGAEFTRKTYQQLGRNLLSAKIPAELLTKRPAEVEFSADRSVTDSATSGAKSLIVVSLGLKEYEQTVEFREAETAKSLVGYAEIIKQRDLKIPAEKQREIMKIFHDLPIWDNLRFHNVRIIKNPLDLWMLQQIAFEVRPDFVIETGTWKGGSAIYWAHTLNGMGLENARVLTVDIQDFTKEGAASHPLWKRYVEFFHGSSTDPKIVSRIAEMVKNKRVIVNLDSDHSMQHVLKELRLYAPLVSPGSYIAVEDTHLDGIPTHPEQGPGPMAAVRQFLAEGGSKDFEQDFLREAMVMTSYPGGWLKRKTPK